MKLIVAVDSNWGIGKNNDLLFHLPADMKHFRESTLNKIVVMGSRTLLSFPNSAPLKNRTNIVLWPDAPKRDDCIIAGSLPELSHILATYPTDDTFIVGGAMFYKTMLPYCDTAIITKVHADGGAQVFLDNLDELANWHLVAESAPVTDGEYQLTFCTYENANPVKF